MVTIVDMSSSKHPPGGKSPRKVLLLFIVIPTVAVLLLTLLPYGIRYGVVRALSSAGAKNVALDDVDFNFFTGQLVLHGLTVEDTDTKSLSLPEGVLTLDWRPLFRKEIRFSELTLKDTELLLEQTEDGRIVVGGISAGAEGSERQKTAGKPWTFTLNRFHLSRVRVRLKTPKLKAVFHIDEANLTGLSNHDPGQPVHLNLKGRLNDSAVNLQADLFPFLARPIYTGKISLTDFDLAGLRPLLPEQWGTEGRLTFDLDFRTNPSGSPPFSIQGKAAAKELRVVDHGRKIFLVTAKSLHLQGIEIEGRQRAAFDEIRGAGVEILSRAGSRPLTRIENMTVRSVRYGAPRVFRMASAKLKGLDTILHRDGEGKFREIEEIFPATETGASAEEGKKTTVEIGRIGITNSSITIQDDAVTPPFHTVLHLNAFSLSNIESEKSNQPSPLNLQGTVGKYTSLKLRGSLYPFAGKTTFELEGNVKGLDLPPLSSYTGKSLGYNLVSGQLDCDFNIKTAKGKIDGEGRLTLNNLEVSPKNEKKMKVLAAQLTMPLDAALAMLRDKKKNIRLTLPVSGQLDDPKFDLSDAINQALGKALKTSAVSFLKYTLQPYGAILTVAQLAGKTITAVRLDPIAFPPGSAELGPGADPYLDRVAALMKERPEVRVKLCGKATPADPPKEGEKSLSGDPSNGANTHLLELARKRASVIKDFLVTRKKIAPERLFICNPEINSDPGDPPRVELLI